MDTTAGKMGLDKLVFPNDYLPLIITLIRWGYNSFIGWAASCISMYSYAIHVM